MDGMFGAVHRSASHTLKKTEQPSSRLLAALWVEEDAHRAVTVQHRPRSASAQFAVTALIPAELHDELCGRGFTLPPEELGENITRGASLSCSP
jgi:hypothetical protein